MAGLDFDTIITKHKSWKSRLRSMLDGKGGLSVSDAVSHKDCDFGRWLYSEGKTKYGSLNELNILEKSHTDMHAKVKEVIQKKNAGDTIGAEQGYTEVVRLSDVVVGLLTSLKIKMRKMSMS